MTQTLMLGTYVIQAGVREPMHVAAEAATLNVLAPGRVLLGIGAGHTFREWADVGRERPGPQARAERLAEFAEAIAALLAGRTVTLHGRHLTLRESRLQDLPGSDRVQLVVGGGHPEVLRAGARCAQVVGLSGLGQTLPDGHHHTVRWSQADLHRQLQIVRDEARKAGRNPAVEALVQRVVVTDDRAAAISAFSARVPGSSVEEISHTPFVLIGSYEQIAAQLMKQADELGIHSYVVREPALPAMERVLTMLRGAFRHERQLVNGIEG